jgi:hypothetical protein
MEPSGSVQACNRIAAPLWCCQIPSVTAALDKPCYVTFLTTKQTSCTITEDLHHNKAAVMFDIDDLSVPRTKVGAMQRGP